MATDTGTGDPNPKQHGRERVEGAKDNPTVLYDDAKSALKAVREDYLYWTGKLTDSSVQLCYALLAANWAVFRSLDGILANFWARGSVLLVVVSLAASLVGAWRMGERHLERIDYAEENPGRWSEEFTATAGKRDPWPYSLKIESLAKDMRWAKTWLPIAAGAAFLIGLVQEIVVRR